MAHVILTGFMGTGKTKVGKILAEKLDRPFVDLDSLVEEREGRKISQIFSREGEGYFRQKETEALKKALQGKGKVISTGGGILLREENRKILHDSGILICLKASPEEIYKRVKKNQERPLLKVENPLKRIRELLKEREKFYEKVPHSILTDGKSPPAVAEEVIDIIKKEFPHLLDN